MPYADDSLVVLPGLYFASPSVGYTWDPTQIDFTTDSGAHWRSLPAPPGVPPSHYQASATVFSAGQLWTAYSTTCLPSDPCDNLISSWNGQRWTNQVSLIPSTIAAMAATPDGVDVVLNNMIGHGEATYSLARLSAGGAVYLGSGHFTCPTNIGFADSVAATTTAVLVECVGSFEAGWAARLYWLSTDNGADWTMRARDAAPPTPDLGTPPQGEGGQLAASDGRFWVAVRRSSLYYSQDGGLTWHPTVVNGSDGGSGTIIFDGANGWCLYPGVGLWHSPDSGFTWKASPAISTG